MKPRDLIAVGMFLLAIASGMAAQAQSISLVDVKCIPRKSNGVVKAAIIPDPAVGQSPRVYFRWKGQPAFYWSPMEVEPKGQYWSVLPRVEERNHEVEYYVAVVDATGKMLSQSEPRSERVDANNCRAELSQKEQGVAENLIVGETTPNQYRKRVIGFECPGLKIRIDHQGIRRSDEECGPCGLAWLPPALATAGILGVVIIDDPEPSPSRP